MSRSHRSFSAFVLTTITYTHPLVCSVPFRIVMSESTSDVKPKQDEEPKKEETPEVEIPADLVSPEDKEKAPKSWLYEVNITR